MQLNFYQTQHIDELMSDATAAEKKENTRCSMKVLQNVVFLGKQGKAGGWQIRKLLPVNVVKSFWP